jgi:hypothetical protein
MDLSDQEFKIISQEIDLVDGRAKQMEDTRRIIKNWCVVTWAASVGLTIKELPTLVFLTGLIPMSFFLLDALSRRQQHAFDRRITKIGEFLNQRFRGEGNASDFHLLELREKFGETKLGSIREIKKTWRITKRWLIAPTIWALYISLSLFSILAWFAAILLPA